MSNHLAKACTANDAEVVFTIVKYDFFANILIKIRLAKFRCRYLRLAYTVCSTTEMIIMRSPIQK